MIKKNKINIYPFFIIGFAMMLIAGCKKSDENNYLPTETNVYTTLDRTMVAEAVPAMPTVLITDPAHFSEYGYGKWHYGPGLPCQKRLDLMPSGYNYASVTNVAKLLRFFTITDIHITDKESPAQALFFYPYAGQLGISCYSPLMLYSTQVFDACIQTVNALHKQQPIDFGLALGDMTNNAQYNELRWFIDILDGKLIKPYSGGVKDPVPGPYNDYQDEFKAAGLAPSIPWYAVLGNHDHFWMGSKPMTDKIRQTLMGDSILKLGSIFSDPNAMNQSTYSMGTLDGSSPYGNIIGSGVVATMGSIPGITPDINRHAVSKTECVNEFSNSISLPTGHGFIQTNPLNVFAACYSFEPKSNLPIKVIVLDDTQEDSDPIPSELIYGHGELNNGRYEWLMAQLQAGQAEGKLMIIAAHVPIGVCQGTAMGWLAATGYTSENNLVSQLQSFPNLILWVSGHRHLNNVTAFKSTDPNHPENSFWEVETKSVREFPEQFRTFDILRNSDNTISIITYNVDPDMKPGSLAAIGRAYAIASNQIYGLSALPLPSGSVSYNAALVKPLSPAMQLKIQNYGASLK